MVNYNVQMPQIKQPENNIMQIYDMVQKGKARETENELVKLKIKEAESKLDPVMLQLGKDKAKAELLNKNAIGREQEIKNQIEASAGLQKQVVMLNQLLRTNQIDAYNAEVARLQGDGAYGKVAQWLSPLEGKEDLNGEYRPGVGVEETLGTGYPGQKKRTTITQDQIDAKIAQMENFTTAAQKAQFREPLEWVDVYDRKGKAHKWEISGLKRDKAGGPLELEKFTKIDGATLQKPATKSELMSVENETGDTVYGTATEVIGQKVPKSEAAKVTEQNHAYNMKRLEYMEQNDKKTYDLAVEQAKQTAKAAISKNSEAFSNPNGLLIVKTGKTFETPDENGDMRKATKDELKNMVKLSKGTDELMEYFMAILAGKKLGDETEVDETVTTKKGSKRSVWKFKEDGTLVK